MQFILAHPLNRGQPIATLARYAAWQVRSRLKDEVEINWIGGTRLIARNGMTGATGNIYCGLHEYRDMSFVLHALRPGDLFVDVGANIGSYTVLASGVNGARSIAIEPDAETAAHLARNIAANELKGLVDVRLTAVGDTSGSIAFTSGRDTMNRVAVEADTNVQMVSLTRLDDILRDLEPTLLKLDVEGSETMALRGAEEILAKSSLLAILLETVDPEALAILTRHGFALQAYDPDGRVLVSEVEAVRGSNALFVRDVPALQEKLRSAPRRVFRGRCI